MKSVSSASIAAFFLSLLLLVRLHPAASFAISPGRVDIITRRIGNAGIRSSERELQSGAGASGDALTWYHLPTMYLDEGQSEDEAMSIINGCDAIVTSLDIGRGEINPEMWVRTCHDPSRNKMDKLSSDSATDSPTEALEAIEATRRWSSNFVRKLQLCPWAGSSLDTPGAIRYWALMIEGDDMGNDNTTGEKSVAVLDEMEKLVRGAGRQLERITSPSIANEGMDPIDPSVAISFVVLVNMTSSDDTLPDFGTFHEFFFDLEDRLLDDCDEYWDSLDEDEEENEDFVDDVPLGCDITVAAFHPHWQFGNGDGKPDSGMVQAIDFEKRTPYPTISIVMSSAIDALMSKRENGDAEDQSSDTAEGASSAPATLRIAEMNEKILEGIGVEQLKEVFEAEVVKCSMSHGEQSQ